MPDTQEDLRLQAAEMLHGADKIIDRLRTLVRVGLPSIADMAYATKFRIKEDYKIIEKVERKKRVDTNYTCSNLRDCEGPREKADRSRH